MVWRYYFSMYFCLSDTISCSLKNGHNKVQGHLHNYIICESVVCGSDFAPGIYIISYVHEKRLIPGLLHQMHCWILDNVFIMLTLLTKLYWYKSLIFPGCNVVRYFFSWCVFTGPGTSRVVWKLSQERERSVEQINLYIHTVHLDSPISPLLSVERSLLS